MTQGYYQGKRPEIYKLVPSGSIRILEIGCAAGCFISNFKSAVEYWGVEPVQKAAEEARSKGIKVFTGIYSDVEGQLPSGYFDVIVCNDVIEHIPNTDDFLTSIKTKLNPKGVVIGSIPNVRYWGILKNLLIKRDWEYGDHGILDRTHVKFFTKKSFARTAHTNGFDVETSFGIVSKPMKILRTLLAPLLLVIGFDVCPMQYAFRLRPITTRE